MISLNENLKDNGYDLGISSADKFLFFLYILYFIISPFYFWKSGYPQIADFVLVAFILFYLIFNHFKISFNINVKSLLIAGVTLIIYIGIVNLSWILKLQSTDRFLLSTMYYIYNFIVFLIVISMYNRYKEKVIKITYIAALLSILLQFVTFLSSGYTGGRMTGSFNNPNQLGYYSLLIASILIFSSTKINVKLIWFLIGLFSCLVLAFSSLSKAAILSIIGLVVFYLLIKKKDKKHTRKFIIIILILTTSVLIINFTTTIFQESQLLNSVENRIESIGNDSDDNLEARGYYRITDYPEYWIFGAGEGAYFRFKNKSIEFHSTLGNIQVSYGIIGSLLFLFIMIKALSNENFRSSYILLFIMAYGLTHNGIRDGMLWILLALIACSSNSKYKQEKSHKEDNYANS